MSSNKIVNRGYAKTRKGMSSSTDMATNRGTYVYGLSCDDYTSYIEWLSENHPEYITDQPADKGNDFVSQSNSDDQMPPNKLILFNKSIKKDIRNLPA